MEYNDIEDNKIQNLFADFQPPLSSRTAFMAKLQKRMDAVEEVRCYNEALKRRYRTAVAVASLCGFACGVLLTLMFPMIYSWVATVGESWSQLPDFNMTSGYNVISWIIVGGISLTTAMTSYELCLARRD